jgi:hypothetical protein
MKSENFSLKGWNLREFLKGNKEFVKILVSLTLGASGFLVTGGYLEAGLASIFGKFALDILDYYVSGVDN